MAGSKPKTKDANGCTEQEEAFIQAYIASIPQDGTLRAAYEKAYDKPGRSYTKQEASKTFAKPHVRARFIELMGPALERQKADADAVLGGIAAIAFYDPRKLFDENGAILPIHKMSDAAVAALASFDVITNENGSVTSKIKLWDKGRAQEQLAKIYKMFAPEEVNVRHSVSFVIEK